MLRDLCIKISYPKEGYLPTPRPPPDIGRGLNRTYSVLVH